MSGTRSTPVATNAADTDTAWQAAFGPTFRPQDIAPFRQHFTDPATAARWAHAMPWHARLAGHLHAHGHHPNAETVRDALFAVSAELDAAERDRSARGLPAADIDTEEATRVALLLIHPHLTRQDRDAITAAGLTLTEVEHHLSNGTLDRDTLATLAALT